MEKSSLVMADSLGEISRLTQPSVHQLFITSDNLEGEDLERKLYVIRRCIEKEIAIVDRWRFQSVLRL